MKAKNTKTTTTNKPAAYTWRGVNCIETPNGVTVTITGAAFRSAKRIARIFSKWDKCEWTAADLIWQSCISTDAALMALGAKDPKCAPDETLPGLLLDEYRKAPDVGELATAFRTAGFNV